MGKNIILHEYRRQKIRRWHVLESDFTSSKKAKQELNFSHHWTVVLKGGACLKHAFGSVLVCGQHLTEIKTSRVRISRYIERETLGFSNTHEWAAQFMVLDKERLDYFCRQTFSPIPFEISVADLSISVKSTLLGSTNNLPQRGNENESQQITWNHVHCQKKDENNFSFSETVNVLNLLSMYKIHLEFNYQH